MKLPYRAGELFALPLGDGTCAEARIALVGHRWVEITAGALRLRVWDDALVLKRWRPGRTERSAEGATSRDVSERIVNPAHAERIVATALGVANLELPPLRVHWTANGRTHAPVPPAIRTVEQLAAVPSDAIALKLCGPCFELRVCDLLRFARLEQLELLGFWQFSIAEVEPLLALPRLLRAEIDIGGRRKNVELYRRVRWAYPWPVELLR